MTYSDTTKLDWIIQNIEAMTDVGSAYISGDTTRLREFTNLVNRVNHRVWHTIFTANGNWQYDDGNYTTMPSSTTDLVSGTAQYTLPTDALTVQRVEAKDSAGNWVVLQPMTKEDLGSVAVDEYMEDNGALLNYRLVNGIIELFPAPDYASTAGLKVYFDRDSVDFVYNATTTTPGFASPYHEILPIGASIEWLKVKQPTSPTLQVLMTDYERINASIEQFYGKRFKDYKPAIGRLSVNYK